MSRWRWGIAAAVAATLAAPITAQENRAVASAPSGAPQTSPLPDLLEDVAVLRAVNGLQLTSAQMGPLVQRLQAGMARVQQAGQADGAAWTAAVRTLRQAIPQAAGGAPTGKADAELARVQQVTRGKEDAAREQTRTEVRALLDQILTPAQKAALLKMGRDEMLRQRLARLESADFNRIDRMGRMLDRLREASPQDYPQERQRFAMQMANLPGGWEIGGQNPAGTARRGGNAPGGGGRGRRGAADGLQSEQQRLRLEQQRQQTREQLADPARRAQVRQFQIFADQMRAMPAQTYAQRRTQLATQLYQSQSQTRAQTASPEQAMDTFIDRYLLVPRAPVVLAERLEAMG